MVGGGDFSLSVGTRQKTLTSDSCVLVLCDSGAVTPVFFFFQSDPDTALVVASLCVVLVSR